MCVRIQLYFHYHITVFTLGLQLGGGIFDVTYFPTRALCPLVVTCVGPYKIHFNFPPVLIFLDSFLIVKLHFINQKACLIN